MEEEIDQTFIQRVLAASQRHLIRRTSDKRPGFKIPIRIIKRRMIRNISSTAEIMHRWFRGTPPPVPQPTSDNSSDEDDDYDDHDNDTDIFDFLNFEDAADGHSNTTDATATADADANNDWWFEAQEELNSDDDDDDEINSYIRYHEDEAANSDNEDALTWLSKHDTDNSTAANVANANDQQQQPPLSSAPDVNNTQDDASANRDIGVPSAIHVASVNDQHQQSALFTPDVNNSQEGTSANLDLESILAANIDGFNGQQQLMTPSTPDTNSSQGDTSTVLAWIANLGPESLITADIDTAIGPYQELVPSTPYQNKYQDYASATCIAHLDPGYLTTVNIHTANGQQQQLALSTNGANHSQADASTALARVAKFDSENFTTVDTSTDTDQHQQMALSATDANKSQGICSAAVEWLINLDPECLTAADIEQALLTHTSDLVPENFASGSPGTENRKEMLSRQEPTIDKNATVPKKDACELLAPSSSLPSPISPHQKATSIKTIRGNTIIYAQATTQRAAFGYPISPPHTSYNQLPSAHINRIKDNTATTNATCKSKKRPLEQTDDGALIEQNNSNKKHMAARTQVPKALHHHHQAKSLKRPFQDTEHGENTVQGNDHKKTLLNTRHPSASRI